MVEVSGTRSDSVSTNHAIEFISTTGSTTGPKGGGDISANFIAASVLNAGSAANTGIDISTAPLGGSHCLFGWVYANSTAGAPMIAGKWNASNSSTLGYILDIESGIAYGYNGGSAYYYAGAAISASAWHFLCMWRDFADGLVRFSIDNGTVYASATSSTPTNVASPLTFGADYTQALKLNGRLSRFGWIKGSFLTSSERTTMYNGGPTGALSWADIVAGGL